MTAIAASGVVTNVWKGSENGGMWNVPDNWTEALTPTVATVYDFSKLEMARRSQTIMSASRIRLNSSRSPD